MAAAGSLNLRCGLSVTAAAILARREGGREGGLRVFVGRATHMTSSRAERSEHTRQHGVPRDYLKREGVRVRREMPLPSYLIEAHIKTKKELNGNGKLCNSRYTSRESVHVGYVLEM